METPSLLALLTVLARDGVLNASRSDVLEYLMLLRPD